MDAKLVMTTERVVSVVREAILSGAYPDGTALRQEKLAAELGCSRVPVREALRLLEAEGLVVTIPRRGAMVAEMSIERIRENFELRSVIEPWLLTVAIPHITDADFAEAEAVIEEMSAMDVEHWGEANWRFHNCLYRRSRKAMALELLQSIHERTDRYIRFHLRLTQGQDKAQKDHSEILLLCRERDAHRASAVLTMHILTVADQLIESVSLARALRENDAGLHPARRTGRHR